MSIWRVEADLSNFKHLIFSKERDSQIVLSVIGETLAYNWQPITVEIEGNDKSKISDFPWLSGSLVCNQPAQKILQTVVADSVQFLPLICSEHQYYLINVTKVINCLDHQLSEVSLFSDGGIRRIISYEFNRECIKGAPIFKIPERLRGPIFVSDTFRDVIHMNNLTGLIFHEVWRGRNL